VKRSEAAELMDDRRIGGAELAEALRQLRWINRLLGAGWPTVEGVERLWRQAGRPRRLVLLDVGAGSGDQVRLLLRWAAWRGVDLRVILVDIHPDTCAQARAFFGGEPRVAVLCADLFSLPAGAADVVTAALFTHHFATDDLPAVFAALARIGRYGAVVNDLHRAWLAWAFILAATRLLSRNRMIRHDAPLSVRRGFVARELAALRAHPTLSRLHFAWRPLFRWLIIIG
jgi:2-polyprenyl-3-methyl-5-hydroxy-6-metoxy-1,4-benzoquinol methylase